MNSLTSPSRLACRVTEPFYKQEMEWLSKKGSKQVRILNPKDINEAFVKRERSSRLYVNNYLLRKNRHRFRENFGEALEPL